MTQIKTVIDTTVLQQQLGSDHEFLAEVIGDYRKQRRQISANLLAALERGDWPEMHALAHRIKGSLLTLGAGPAAAAARELESLAHADTGEGLDNALASLEAELDRLEPELSRLSKTGFGSR